MKKYIAKIREWFRAIIREEVRLVIAEFHEIKQSEQKLAAVVSHWRADAETLEADHSLKMVK